MSFGENIKKQRRALGMTLEEVADKVGVTRQTMSRYETGVIKNYSPETISKIAEALDTTAACLISYDESDTSTEIGERIKALRLKNGLTLDEVARKIGVNNATVSRWETGEIKAIGSDKIGALADILGTTTEYLLGRSNNTERTKKLSRYDMPFPTRLRELLNRPGETQGKLAEAIGVQRQSIGQWKDGITSPDINAFNKIADYYNVSADYLLGRKSLDDTTPIESLRAEREALKQELSKLRKAVSDMNKILETL